MLRSADLGGLSRRIIWFIAPLLFLLTIVLFILGVTVREFVSIHMDMISEWGGLLLYLVGLFILVVSLMDCYKVFLLSKIRAIVSAVTWLGISAIYQWGYSRVVDFTVQNLLENPLIELEKNFTVLWSECVVLLVFVCLLSGLHKFIFKDPNKTADMRTLESIALFYYRENIVDVDLDKVDKIAEKYYRGEGVE